MDPISHGIVGALLSGCAAPHRNVRPALWVGFVAALVPDLDIFARSADDPLLQLELHREFTHSLVLIPVIAATVSLATWPFVRHLLAPWALFRAALLGVTTAGLLDACTSYGTELLWPFVRTRFAFNIVSVVDPLFTLGLLVTLVLAFVRQARTFAVWGICLGLIYLGFGWVQHERATFVGHTLANDRGHRIERMEAKPTLGNLLVWRTIYLSNGRFYVDAVRLSPLSDIRIYEGRAIAKAYLEALPLPPDSVQHRDVRRFARLSDSYTVIHPDDPSVIGDVRYSMVPHSTVPLWGIRLNLNEANSHVTYVTFRESSKAALAELLGLILGTENALRAGEGQPR